MGLVTA